MNLDLAPDLSLPVDAVTQTFFVVGKRESGKSNTCVRLAEQLFKCGVPFVTVDPVDNWWGIKSSKDGKGKGLGVYVFGGSHADAPLEPTAGALMADVIVEHRISAVLSVKHFSIAARARFVSDLCERLFARNTDPLHVFLEEAHEVAPQNPMKGEEEMVGRVARIWKLGRSSGLGGSAVTQRPASLNKNITTQAEILIVHRVLGPQDVAAVKEWIRYHGDSEDILGQLSTLAAGEAFVWAPSFPPDKPIGLRRVRMHRRETFDSAATPKAGERRVEPKAFANVDLEAISKAMAATIERAKADDPKALRKRIAELERAASTSKSASVSSKASTPELAAARARIRELEAEIVRSDRARAAHEKRKAAELRKLARGIAQVHENLASARSEIEDYATEAEQYSIAAPPKFPAAATPAAPSEPLARRIERPAAAARAATSRAEPKEGLTGPEQRILDALAELEALGVTEPPRVQVALFAGYSNLTSKGFANSMGTLRTAGRIEYGAGTIRLTDDGRALAKPCDQPSTEDELHERVFALLGGAAQKVLQPLIDARGDEVSREAVMEVCGFTNATSKGFANTLGRLRSLGLIEYPTRGMLAATDILFLDRGSAR